MTSNNNFNTMMENALSNIDETLEPIHENNMTQNPYTLTQALQQEGFIYDNDGVYIPFKEEFQNIDNNNITTRDDLYLWVSRNLDKKLELHFKWAKKTTKGFKKKRGFKTDFTLDIGDEKTLKRLNKQVSFAGEKNGNPSTENTYVSFVDYFIDKILESECLEILKEDTFEPQQIAIEDTQNNEEKANVPQTFSDYPEDVQQEAINIINEGKLFEEMQTSVSLTHEGHKTTRDALILMEASLFTGDGVHGNLGGDSGMGKTDLAVSVAYNFPEKYVYILRNISPKNIYYDFESYNDDYNIVIFDDIDLNNEKIIEVVKELADNLKKVKELKTVKENKSMKYRLKGKYEVIITYAKTIDDDELLNRFFNLGVTIIDKKEIKKRVKEKIRDNNTIGGNDNLIIQRKRLIMQACIHYLIEQDLKVYNPYSSIFNPTNYNNRDVNYFLNMTKARTFFEYTQREQIQINDELSLTISSYDDLKFVHKIWAKDEEAQLHKLSERQKQILKALPEMTIGEAFEHVKEINKFLNDSSKTRVEKKKRKDEETFANSLAKKLKCSRSTLKRDLDKFEEGTHKSLLEIGIVDKIQLDENQYNSPNFYYKIKNEGTSFDDENNINHIDKIRLNNIINTSIAKQKIIIDLLIYVNILINEKGMYTLKKYCENYKHKLDVEDYKQLIDFLQGFFKFLNYNKHTIKVSNASSDDINNMMNFKTNIENQLQKKDTHTSSSEVKKNTDVSNQEENSSNTKQSKNNIDSSSFNNLGLGNFRFKEQMDKKHIDVEIACQIYEALKTKPATTLQEITNHLCKYDNPDDYEQEQKPLKIQVNLEKLCTNKYINSYYKNNTQVYEVEQKFIDLIEDAKR